jgi:hypothetical protein
MKVELYARGMYPNFEREITSKDTLIEQKTQHGIFCNNRNDEERTIKSVLKHEQSHKDKLKEIFTIGVDNYTIDEFCKWKYSYNNFDFRSSFNYTKNNTQNEIWCFGCSFTEGNGVPENRRWTNQLQNYTERRVINYGLSGTGINTAYRILLNWIKHVDYPPGDIINLGFFEGRAEHKRTYDGNTFYRPTTINTLDGLKKRNNDLGPLEFKISEHGYSYAEIETYLLQESSKDDFYHNGIKDICGEYNINYHIETPLFIEKGKPFYKDGLGRDLAPMDLESDMRIDDIFLPDICPGLHKPIWALHPSPVYHRKIAHHFSNCIKL